MNSTSFVQSERFLNGDRAFVYVLWLVIPACLIAMWTAWLFLARVPIYVPSNSARLEVERHGFSLEVQCRTDKNQPAVDTDRPPLNSPGCGSTAFCLEVSPKSPTNHSSPSLPLFRGVFARIPEAARQRF